MNITAFAQYAGVSKAAVSRYFNGGYLSAEKRAQIAAAVEATGYRPSMQAQMLRTRRTRQVGVILPKLSSDSCPRIVEGIGSVTTGDTPAAGIRDGKLCLTLPRGLPGPQGDPGEGLSDNAKALLLSLLAGTAPDRDASLAALRAEWGVADRSTDIETAAAAPGVAGADTETASAERGA